MSGWLAVLATLLGFQPEPAVGPAEATVEPLAELAVPEMAGAERQVVRFRDEAAAIEVQRSIARNDDGFAIVDHRTWSGGYAPNELPWNRRPVLPIGLGELPALSTDWHGDLDGHFFSARSAMVDCIVLRRPVRLRDDPGNVAKVVEVDVVALLCLRRGMLGEGDIRRVADALHVNDDGPSVSRSRPLPVPRRRDWRELPSQPFPFYFRGIAPGLLERR